MASLLAVSVTAWAETAPSPAPSPAPSAAPETAAAPVKEDADIEGLKKVHYGRICGVSCANSVTTVAVFNEQGKCVASHSYPCYPFRCDSKTKTCAAKCESSSDCAKGASCHEGECSPK